MAMNDKARSLGTFDTIFYNPHGNDGYDAERNLSNAMEMAKICFAILDNSRLSEIVNTKKYNRWTNTNKLLWEGFHGIKTGTNELAGPCLAACYQNILIVVLNCRTLDDRWLETKKLTRWAASRN
jgi:D-alanyl-D-alanine carboxypeptidase (penicillin-binding protein 5/6)